MARVAVREEAERRDAGIVRSAAAVGAALLADRAVQETVAQEATEHRERGGVGVTHRHRRVGLGAEVHLGAGLPDLAHAGAHRLQREWPGRCGRRRVAPARLQRGDRGARVVGIRDEQQLARRGAQQLVQLGQARSEGGELGVGLQGFLQRAGATDALQPRQRVSQQRRGAHAARGRGHRQAVAAAGDRLVAPRAHLAQQLAQALQFVEARAVQRLAHQREHAVGVASQRLRRDHQHAAGLLLVGHAAADGGVGAQARRSPRPAMPASAGSRARRCRARKGSCRSRAAAPAVAAPARAGRR